MYLEWQDDYIRYKFTTITSPCNFVVTNVAYSNDGYNDTVRIFISSSGLIGEFLTNQKFGDGHLWNVIRNSGPVGNIIKVTIGSHTLTLEVVSPDKNGVEPLDALTLSFTCNNSTAADAVCQQFATENTATPTTSSPGLSPGVTGKQGLEYGTVSLTVSLRCGTTL